MEFCHVTSAVVYTNWGHMWISIAIPYFIHEAELCILWYLIHMCLMFVHCNVRQCDFYTEYFMLLINYRNVKPERKCKK